MVDCYILIRESTGHSCLKEKEVAMPVRGRLEESSSCPAKSDRRIEKYVSQEWFKLMWPKLERNEYSSPRKVAKSPLFSIYIATEGGASNRVKITIRVSPDKRKNPQLVLGSRLLSFTEEGIARPLAWPFLKLWKLRRISITILHPLTLVFSYCGHVSVKPRTLILQPH